METGQNAKLEDLGDAHLTPIGLITVNFSRLEFWIKLCINHLLGSGQNEGLIATSQLNFRSLTTVLVNLYRRKNLDNPGGLAKFDDVIKRVDQAAEKRNLVVHSDWSLSPKDGLAVGVKFPQGRPQLFAPRIFETDPLDLLEIARFIKGVSYEVGALLIEISGGPMLDQASP